MYKDPLGLGGADGPADRCRYFRMCLEAMRVEAEVGGFSLSDRLWTCWRGLGCL